MGGSELVAGDTEGGAELHPWAVWARQGDESREYWAREEWGPYASLWYRGSLLEMEPGGTYKRKEHQ